MGFPLDVKEQALLKCKRHCVLCEENKGVKIECHHIKQRANGGEDTLENCIPLCFDCHEEVGSYNPKHPKGNKYTESELKRRRDNFYARVENGEFPIKNNMKENYVNNIKECDKKLYDYICEIFNSPNLKYYLVDVDLGNDFDNEVFEPLLQLKYISNDPNYSFVDYHLNEVMNELLKSIDNFLEYKSKNTFNTNLGTRALKTWKNYNYTEKESMKIITEFNDLATDIWDKYCMLAKSFRKKL